MDARELEIRCPSCDAGFAVGTQRCIHCGRPLGTLGQLTQAMSTLSTPADGQRAEEDSGQAAALNGVISGGAVVALMVATWLIRACS